jgi:hypothetical protein
MAISYSVYNTSKVTLEIIDYTGSPNTHTAAGIVTNVIFPPAHQTFEHAEPLVNSSSGQTQWAYFKVGIAAGQKIQLQMLAFDLKNSADTTATFSLLNALANGTVAGTAFSTWTLTNPLTAGGKIAAKFKFTLPNEAGVSSTFTVPCCVDSVEIQNQGNSVGYAVSLQVVGAVTIA